MNEGHNSGIGHDQLRAIISRLERLNESKAVIQEDIKEVMAAAKSDGFDLATIRKVIRLRNIDPVKRAEQEAMLDLYMSSVGDGEL